MGVKQTKIRYNMNGLEELKKASKGMKARVGIMGAQSARSDASGLTNPEVGVIQIFGSYEHKIPPRDFLLYPIIKNERKIVSDLRGSQMVKEALDRGDVKKVFKLLGLIALKYVHEAFATAGWGSWAPNRPSTIDRKGSSQPLIDTAQLERSCTSTVVQAGRAGGLAEI
jgi:hypothetical protein